MWKVEKEAYLEWTRSTPQRQYTLLQQQSQQQTSSGRGRREGQCWWQGSRSLQDIEFLLCL